MNPYLRFALMHARCRFAEIWYAKTTSLLSVGFGRLVSTLMHSEVVVQSTHQLSRELRAYTAAHLSAGAEDGLSPGSSLHCRVTDLLLSLYPPDTATVPCISVRTKAA